MITLAASNIEYFHIDFSVLQANPRLLPQHDDENDNRDELGCT